MKYVKNIAIIILVAGLFTACNKEDMNTGKAMQIVINGYNGGSNALQLAIDTTQYDVSVAYGNYIVKPASLISFNTVYTYQSDKKRMLTLTDTITKQVVYSGELPSSGTNGLFNYIFLDGKELEINPPAADPATNKLAFYVYYPASNEPFDIFLYRKNNSTGQEFREYLAKNVTPGKWVYVDYTATDNFGTKTLLSSSSVRCTKAGTTDKWAFDNDQTKSQMEANGFFLPIAGEKGFVQPYFIKPMPYNQGLSKLFFYPDRI
jgi:hypothetical protein